MEWFLRSFVDGLQEQLAGRMPSALGMKSRVVALPWLFVTH